jgi:hypothetical protein
MNHPATSDDRTTTATLGVPTDLEAGGLASTRTSVGVGVGVGVGVVLVGSDEARRQVYGLLGVIAMTEVASWQDLPVGPAVCIDADRFVHLSPAGVAALAGAVLAGSDVAVPSSNIGIWPMCGFYPPRGAADANELEAHAAAIAGRPSEHSVDASFPLPAVFALADASRIRTRPVHVGDLGECADVVATVWCHHRDVPFISATMIVKNEAARIESAVAAAQLVADEVVVYDTGSTDDTVELARAMGAAVRLGYWDDDFGRARNEAWAMMRGDWSFVVDADDTVEATPEQVAELRELLRGAPTDMVVSLPVKSVHNEVSGMILAGMIQRRVFPRHMHWRNRIHEVVMRPDGVLPDELRFEQIAVVHWGYSLQTEKRSERNLRIAEKRLAESDGSASNGLDLYEYGRALQFAGQVEEALDVFSQVIAEHTEGPAFVLSTLLTACLWCDTDRTMNVQALLRPIAEGHQDPAARGAARWVLATSLGEPDVALEMLAGLESVQYYNFVASPDEVRSLHVFMAALVGDHDLAFRQLAAMREPTKQESTWWAASMAVKAGDPRIARHIVSAVGVDELAFVVCALAGGPADGNQELAGALVERFGLQPQLAVYMAQVSARGGFFAALDARLRLAEAGQLEVGDPLERLLDGTYGDAADQMLAALVLDSLEPVAPTRSLAVGPGIATDNIEDVLGAVASVLPQQLTEAASALATSPERGTVVARALDGLDGVSS